MEREESDRPDVCAVCGAQVFTETEPTFGFGTGNLLCGECAEARGGRYDAERDTWDRPPDLSGLRDEAYGSAPHEVRRRRD
jgi:hypothetical protein